MTLQAIKQDGICESTKKPFRYVSVEGGYEMLRMFGTLGEFRMMWEPQDTCLSCGSRNVKIGCQYQDCDEHGDEESSECLDCGLSWGGANYWK